MPSVLSRLARLEFAPPSYLAFPTAGIDLSASGVKIALLKEHIHGLELEAFSEERLSPGAMTGGEIRDRGAVVAALRTLAGRYGIRFAHIALSESRSYLFEADVPGIDKAAWMPVLEPKLEEYVPLPPSEVVFDIAAAGRTGDGTKVVGIAYARRMIQEALSVFDEAGITVRSLESETFALPRALLPAGSPGTAFLVDVGRTTTKVVVAVGGVPRFAATLDLGGHALTLAVQKHFGVSEEEAKRIKAERGIVGPPTDEYVASMLSTVSVIRDALSERLEYWQTHAARTGAEPASRIILVGGNATVRGLPEYLEAGLNVPVSLGDVFTNLASRDAWLPQLSYLESLAYATPIGLALRDYV